MQPPAIIDRHGGADAVIGTPRLDAYRKRLPRRLLVIVDCNSRVGHLGGTKREPIREWIRRALSVDLGVTVALIGCFDQLELQSPEFERAFGHSIRLLLREMPITPKLSTVGRVDAEERARAFIARARELISDESSSEADVPPSGSRASSGRLCPDVLIASSRQRVIDEFEREAMRKPTADAPRGIYAVYHRDTSLTITLPTSHALIRLLGRPIGRLIATSDIRIADIASVAPMVPLARRFTTITLTASGDTAPNWMYGHVPTAYWPHVPRDVHVPLLEPWARPCEPTERLGVTEGPRRIGGATMPTESPKRIGRAMRRLDARRTRDHGVIGDRGR